LLNYILKRLLMMVPVLLGVLFIIFTLTYMAPGDPATIILGEAASQEALNEVREELGLNDPFLVQFATFAFSIFTLDFGNSWNTGRPIIEDLAARFPATIQLAFMGTMLAVTMGIPLGIISATKQYSIFDAGATFLALLGASIPNFWLGMMLIMLFTVNLGMLPPSGFATPAHWVMPTIAIGTSGAAIIMRMTRSSMLEVIRQDYIRTARAKGQTESKIILNHALKNALIPVMTVVGLQIGFLLGGAVITESIFSIPGIGTYMIGAIGQRDRPIIISSVVVLAVIFSFVNLLVDILYAYADPRIRSQYK